MHHQIKDQNLHINTLFHSLCFFSLLLCIPHSIMSSISTCLCSVITTKHHEEINKVQLQWYSKHSKQFQIQTRLVQAMSHFRSQSSRLFVRQTTFSVSNPTWIQLQEEYDEHDKHIQHAVNKMKGIITKLETTGNSLEKLVIIDIMQRCGISYYFEDEIHEMLKGQYAQHNSWEQMSRIYDLHEVALRFRLLRQEGYYISPDVFTKFKDDKGKFKEELHKDIRGLLSLLEASQMSIQDEDILDDASHFSREVLEGFLMKTIPHAQTTIIEYILKHPSRKCMSMSLLAESSTIMDFFHKFIGLKTWTKDLLNLVGISVEMAQVSSRKELLQISQWRVVNYAKKLEFARIKPIKWYMWSSAIIPWPDMVEERIEVAKVVSFIYVIDDIFDNRGTLDELSLFTKVISRWDRDDIEQLPEYMKVCLKALYGFTDDFSIKIYQKHKLNPKHSLVKVWIDLCNSFLNEAKWLKQGQMPGAKEYLNNGILSVGVYQVLMHVFFLLDGVNQHSIDEMDHFPCIVSSSAIIVRLWNDIITDQNLNRKDYDGSYINCLKNENQEKWIGQSAREHARKMISDAWKSLNKECMASNSLYSEKFKKSCLNFARMADFFYNHDVEIQRQSLEKHLHQLIMNGFANEVVI